MCIRDRFWQQCGADGTIDTLARYIPEDNIFGKCIVGASFGKDAADSNYPYAIGGYYNGEPVADPDLTVEEIPAHTYAEMCIRDRRICWILLIIHSISLIQY